MENKFVRHIKQKHLFEKRDRILVAVSGGVDSMVLSFLLLGAGYDIAIAHCNYQLRGEDSETDEKLVRMWASQSGIPFHSKRIDTEKLVEESNGSVQMVAREERYRFFSGLMQKHGYAATALAHHADDRIESLLINVLRGTGIRGLVGMRVKRDRYVRPLLFSTKVEIRQYAEQHGIPFREDASNAEIGHKRNWVRLRLLPMLRKTDPKIDGKLLSFSERVENELPDYMGWVEEEKTELLSKDGISIPKLRSSKYPFTILKEIMGPKGFSSDQVFQLLGMLDGESGSEVGNDHYRIVKDREHLIVSERDHDVEKPKLTFELLPRSEIDSLKTKAHIALFDADKIRPENLKLRHWKDGDRFRPLGMQGWKKLSDFFIDEKISVLEKEQIWLLLYNGEIVWIIGKRPDERFKVTGSTERVLKVCIE